MVIIIFFLFKKVKNACPILACLNDGECIQTNNNFTCSCKTGFNGTNCETCKEIIQNFINYIFNINFIKF